MGCDVKKSSKEKTREYNQILANDNHLDRETNPDSIREKPLDGGTKFKKLSIIIEYKNVKETLRINPA